MQVEDTVEYLQLFVVGTAALKHYPISRFLHTDFCFSTLNVSC